MDTFAHNGSDEAADRYLAQLETALMSAAVADTTDGRQRKTLLAQWLVGHGLDHPVTIADASKGRKRPLRLIAGPTRGRTAGRGSSQPLRGDTPPPHRT